MEIFCQGVLYISFLSEKYRVFNNDIPGWIVFHLCEVLHLNWNRHLMKEVCRILPDLLPMHILCPCFTWSKNIVSDYICETNHWDT